MISAGRNSRFLLSWALALLFAASASGEAGRVAEWRVRQRLSGLAISFVANAGQTDPAVAYYAQTFAGTVFVTRDGRIVYSLPEKRDSDSPRGRKASASLPRAANAKAGWSLTETAVGGRASPAAGGLATANVNSFIANDPACWTSSLPTYEDLSLGEVWPGISLELKARGNSVEKIFTVEPGADPSKIRMAVRGARSLTVNESGALVLGTGPGEVTFTPPMAYQESGGARPPVDVAYELRGGDYGFRLGDYDPALPVIIDPLVQSTYLGGGRDDIAVAVAVHPVSGDVYVVGQTTSTNFPGTAGGAQPGAGGGAINAIVARFNPALTALLQATYLGAASDVIANALAIHPTSGDVYVAGQTSALDFPGTAGGAQPSHADEVIAGSDDGFVAILNPALTALTGATYLGGTRDDVVTALAIHPTSGEVYAAGWTLAMNFPGTFGGAQPGSGGGGPSDAFLARLNPALTTLAQATYLGGGSYDLAFGLGIQPISGDVYVAGLTTSTNFPGTAGGAQPTHAIDTGLDVFAARLNSALTVLVQATYLGGSGDDSALALAVHPTSGDVFVAGRTYSTRLSSNAGRRATGKRRRSDRRLRGALEPGSDGARSEHVPGRQLQRFRLRPRDPPDVGRRLRRRADVLRQLSVHGGRCPTGKRRGRRRLRRAFEPGVDRARCRDVPGRERRRHRHFDRDPPGFGRRLRRRLDVLHELSAHGGRRAAGARSRQRLLRRFRRAPDVESRPLGLQRRRDHALPEQRPLQGGDAVDDATGTERRGPGRRVDLRHRLLLVLLVQQCRDGRQGRRWARRQLPVLGLRGRADQRQRRDDGDRHSDRSIQDLHEPARRRLPAHPGHERLRQRWTDRWERELVRRCLLAPRMRAGTTA